MAILQFFANSFIGHLPGQHQHWWKIAVLWSNVADSCGFSVGGWSLSSLNSRFSVHCRDNHMLRLGIVPLTDLIRHHRTPKNPPGRPRLATPGLWSILSYCPIDAQAVAGLFDTFLGNRANRLQNRAEYLPELKRWRIGYRMPPGRAEQLATEAAYEAATRYFRKLHGGPISPHLGKKMNRPKKAKPKKSGKKRAKKPRAAPIQARNKESLRDN